MSPLPPPDSASAQAPLPPLPNFPQGGQPQPAGGGMAAMMTGLAPVKQGVDAIAAACKSIVQSGAVPGSEQVCGQIVALAASLLPMAVQSAMAPGGGNPGGQAPLSPMGGQ